MLRSPVFILLLKIQVFKNFFGRVYIYIYCIMANQSLKHEPVTRDRPVSLVPKYIAVYITRVSTSLYILHGQLPSMVMPSNPHVYSYYVLSRLKHSWFGKKLLW